MLKYVFSIAGSWSIHKWVSKTDSRGSGLPLNSPFTLPYTLSLHSSRGRFLPALEAISRDELLS
jgi:hypothetical protein